jgi:hypothetical protein
MKVLAKDAKAGQWYQVVGRGGDRVLCCNQRYFWTPQDQTFQIANGVELTHLPDCTGWDWQPPKPETKYRAFANAAEYMPHRGRWVYFCDDMSNQLLPYSINDRYIWHANRSITWGEMFAQAKFADDGTPFGVEVEQ